ncbi:MAG: phage tail tape measure protein [Oscillospiraceae bacterium]
MADGKLLFETGIDNSGFNSGISNLSIIADNAIASIATNIVSSISSAVAQIPAQMVDVGSGFEASMSQVAATMGITSAAAEFETLSNAAKEMGETTKFSASQAGEALNYLALAGYDAEKAVNALPTVLNVAAAGGMELAAASDMITDAMSALGLETSQMADFADKLAVTSQKSNTSVEQLGSAILTVGGTAKQLAGGVTEMNTALGLLADNGIKGAEGGTALRNIILSLTAPTNTAAEAIDALGLQVYDAQGKMRSLQDIVADFNDILNNMETDAERNQALNDVFNKVDLKSVNALLGTSAERWDELSGYIDSCSGAAADMAATMDDNLKGDLTIMQSALEGLGIAAYEKFQTPMRTAVQSVTEDVGTLTESLTDGKLSDSFDKISEGFGNLAETGSEILSNNIIPAAINGLGTIIEYGNEIISVTAGIGAAIVAINITPFIVKFIAGIQTANLQLALLAAQSGTAAISQTALAGGLTATEVAVGVFTGKITLATAAQAAFNAVLNLNPVVLVATGIAALTAAIVYCATETKRATTATNEYADAMSKVQENSQSYINDSETEIALLKRKVDRYEELRSNLDNLNSNEMAEFLDLADELQNKLPEGTELIDEQTGAYKSLAGSIDSVIEKMRIQAVLNSKQDAYDLAVTQNYDIDDKLDKLDELLNNRNDVDPGGDYSNLSDEGFRNKLSEKMYGISYDELQRTKEYNDSIISEYEDIYRSQYEAATGAKFSYLADYYSKQGKQAYNAMSKATEELQLSQEEMTEKLKEGWKQAEHDYAIGVIGSDEALIAEKQRIWNEYGDESCTDHWQYYENLIKLQDDYADDAKKAEEKAAREREDAVKAEWKAIEHQNSIGLLSDEDAYKKKLEFIQKYCPEYSDEWYDYYRDVYDYQQAYADKQLDELKDSMEDQIDVVKDGLKDILSEYKSAYKDIQSNIDSFKNKLLSLGDAFSVIENKDGSKTLKVNNLTEQMEEMRKYTEYVKKLKSEGASQSLIEELTSMDAADGMEFAKRLANMSDADFAQINDYYKQRDELAQELAEDLYSSDVSKLNENLVNDIVEQFDLLPEEIQAIGAESVNAFIEGLGAGDLSEQVESFIGNFGTELDNGLDTMFEDWDEKISESIGDSIYEAGKTSGEDFVNGFNEALSELEAAVTAEQAKITAEYSGETKLTNERTDLGTADGNQKLVIENKSQITLEVDGKQLAETVEEHQNTIDRGKGK